MKIFSLVLGTYAALFAICNPFGNAAIFLSLTEGQSRERRLSQANRASIWMFALLSGFFAGGTFIMHFFGFSIDAVRLAGGLVVMRVGFNLLQPAVEHTHTPAEHEEAVAKDDISFSPMALPLLAGPGAIAAVMGRSAEIHVSDWPAYLAVVGGIAAVVLTSLLVLRESDWMVKALGINGMNALARLMGFLLICIAAQMVVSGLQGAFPAWSAGPSPNAGLATSAAVG